MMNILSINIKRPNIDTDSSEILSGPGDQDFVWLLSKILSEILHGSGFHYTK